MNRNKRSVTLNLSTPILIDELFLDSRSSPTSWFENFRPGTWLMGRRYDCLMSNHYISLSRLSGFASSLSHRVGYDPVAQHFSGFTSINGDPTGGPDEGRHVLGDDLAGLHAALGALAALRIATAPARAST